MAFAAPTGDFYDSNSIFHGQEFPAGSTFEVIQPFTHIANPAITLQFKAPYTGFDDAPLEKDVRTYMEAPVGWQGPFIGEFELTDPDNNTSTWTVTVDAWGFDEPYQYLAPEPGDYDSNSLFAQQTFPLGTIWRVISFPAGLHFKEGYESFEDAPLENDVNDYLEADEGLSGPVHFILEAMSPLGQTSQWVATVNIIDSRPQIVAPTVTATTHSSLSVAFTLDKAAAYRLIALAADATPPANANAILTGALTTLFDSGLIASAPAGSRSVTVIGLVANTAYDLYIAARTPSDEVNFAAILNVKTSAALGPTITLLGANPMIVEAGGTFTDPGATATDPQDGDVTEDILVSGVVNMGVPGSYTRMYTITNSFGISASVTRTVTVVDTTAPAITLSGANPLTLEAGTTYVEPGYSATDSVDGNLTSDVVVTGTVNHLVPGTYTKTYTVVDASGNQGQVTRTINVVDTTAPTLTLLGANPFTLEAGSTYVEPGYTAYDIVDGNVAGSVTVTGTLNNLVPGTYTKTYTVKDAANNTATATRTINVVDTLSPTITLFGSNPMTVEAGTPFVDPGYTATDVVDGDLTSEMVVTGTVDSMVPGTYTLTYTVQDSAGNQRQVTRTVNVVDSGAPMITLLGTNPMTLEAGTSYVEPGYTATDAIDGDLTGDVVVTGTVNTMVPGVYTKTYTVEDSTGNQSQVTRTINVVDTIAPTITLLGANPLTLESGETYVEPGFTAADIVDGSLTSEVVVTGTVNTLVPGTYTRTYTVTDSSGNTATATRTVNVVDIVVPSITLQGDNPLTVEAGLPYVEPGYSAFDNIDGDITDEVQVTGTVNTMVPGLYTLTYRVEDASGNAYQTTRTVNVVDTTAPTITLLGDAVMQAGSSGLPFEDPGYTAYDIVDGDLTDAVEVTGFVDRSTVGLYVLSYAVTDSSGNTAMALRTVSVVDARAPVITLLGSSLMTVEAGTAYVEPGAMAYDPEDGDISELILVTGLVDTMVPGTYTRTYRVEDNAGNQSTVTRTIDVVDTTAPTITLLGDNPLVLEAGASFVEPGYTATDVVDGNVTSQVQVAGFINTSVPGNYTLVYSARDAANNLAQVTRTVTIVDTIAPTLTLVGAATMTLEAGTPWVDPGAFASDYVGGNLTGSIIISGSVNGNVPGTYTLTYTVSDAAGNVSQATRTVTVADTTPPALTLLGDNPLVLPQGTLYQEPGATAIDSFEGDLTAHIEVEGTVDIGVIGTYQLVYRVSDSAGNLAEKTRTIEVIGSSSLTLVVGENSFATYSDLLTELNWNPQLAALKTYSPDEQKAAMAAAYFNILGMQPNQALLDVEHFGQLVAEDIAALPQRIQKQLMRAQLIEANLLLGGNPIEDRRRLGMISDSNGESAQFFRTAVPLQLPVFRETAMALTGLIVYTLRLSR